MAMLRLYCDHMNTYVSSVCFLVKFEIKLAVHLWPLQLMGIITSVIRPSAVES